MSHDHTLGLTINEVLIGDRSQVTQDAANKHHIIAPKRSRCFATHSSGDA